MCAPTAAVSAIQAIASIGTSIAKTAMESKQQAKEQEYRSQVAISNIKSAQNSAQQQIQTGIEKSREEKINGIKKASMMLAKNASNGSDALSDTNYQNYSDIFDTSYSDAQNILDDYSSSADSYFQKANSYLNEYNLQSSKYKSNARKNMINSLGNYAQVAMSWFK